MTPRNLLPFVLGVVLMTGGANANEASDPPGAFYAVSVADLERAVAWYRDVLGFALESTDENEERAAALMTRSGVLLELASFSSAAARHPAIGFHELHGYFKVGFLVADIEAEFALLQQAKVDVFFPIVEASNGRQTFGIKDPEGNVIQFFGPNDET